jgi:ribose transport system substrate-binding protein
MPRIKQLTTFAVVATALVACAVPAPRAAAPAQAPAQPAEATAQPAAETARKLLFGFSQANNGHPWRVAQTNAVQKSWEANYKDQAELIVTDAQNKPEKQTADVEDMITRKIDVLILTPVTADAMSPVTKKAIDAGIKVITLDRQVNTPVTLHIGADNKLIGKAAAKYIAEKLNGKGNIIEIQGTLGASATTDRHDQFLEELKNYPDVKVIASQTADYSREPALKFMEDTLQRFGPDEFQVVYAHNDEMALGAVQALKAADRLKDVLVVGIDGQNEAFDSIKKGEMAATFTYPNGGTEGVIYAAKLMNGDKLPETLVLDSAQVDASNVDEWIGKGF